MSVKFLLAFQILLPLEGGLVDDPHDPGGITKYGISLRAFPELKREGIKNLTKKDAMSLYKKHYWDKVQAEKLPHRLSICVFDSAVNQGVPTAAKLLQEAVGAKTDGIIGPKTIAAVESRHEEWLLDEYMALRQRRYIMTNNYNRYGKGWTRRLFHVCRESTKVDSIANLL